MCFFSFFEETKRIRRRRVAVKFRMRRRRKKTHLITKLTLIFFPHADAADGWVRLTLKPRLRMSSPSVTKCASNS
jgi:hypothetical protein